MERLMGSANFRWPPTEDKLEYRNEDILCSIEAPYPTGSFYRDQPLYSFPSDTQGWVSAALEERMAMDSEIWKMKLRLVGTQIDFNILFILL